MDFKDFLDNNFNGHDPADLKKLIDFLKKEENLEKLFNFWNTLESSELNTSLSDDIFENVIEEIRGLNETIDLRNG
jgi:hypothetical protein